MGAEVKVSVVIPVRNEEKYVASLLDSVLGNDFPQGALEVLIVDGMSTDRTRDLVLDYARKHSAIRLLDNPRQIIPSALNIGINAARGEVVVRMDAHTTYAPDYISQAVQALEGTGATMVGGMQRPLGDSPVTRAIAAATTSRFGMGNSYYHYGDQMCWVEDSVYLGVWRRSTLIQLGGFNERWLINEDSELNHRLRAAGGKILLCPELRSSYHVRGSFSALARQFFRYGLWRARTCVVYPTSVGWRHLAAPMLVLSLLLSLVLSSNSLALALLVPCSYLLTNLCTSGAILLRQGWNRALVPFAFCTIHLSWGSGFLIGLFRFVSMRWVDAQESST